MDGLGPGGSLTSNEAETLPKNTKPRSRMKRVPFKEYFVDLATVDSLARGFRRNRKTALTRPFGRASIDVDLRLENR